MSSSDIAGWLWILAWFCVMWRLRQWDKKFAAMYQELLQKIREMDETEPGG